MNRKSTTIPEPIVQLRRQLNQFRSAQPRRTKQSSPPIQMLIELQRHVRELAASPAEWMPWNYRRAIERAGV